MKEYCKNKSLVPLLVFVLLFCFGATAENTDSESRPVIGYQELDCQGESQEFESETLLQKGTELYWSWHPVDDPESCSNLEMEEIVVYGQKIPDVFFTPLIVPSVLSSIDFNEWSKRRWNKAIRETQNCWRKKAREAGVSFHKKKFKIEVDWSLQSQGLTVRREKADGSWVLDGIFINPRVIGEEASVHNHWFYTDFVYTIIHETIHAERLITEEFIDHVILEERKVQELAFDRYKDIYGKQPPFSYKLKTDLEQELEDSDFRSLRTEYRASLFILIFCQILADSLNSNVIWC